MTPSVVVLVAHSNGVGVGEGVGVGAGAGSELSTRPLLFRGLSTSALTANEQPGSRRVARMTMYFISLPRRRVNNFNDEPSTQQCPGHSLIYPVSLPEPNYSHDFRMGGIRNFS